MAYNHKEYPGFMVYFDYIDHLMEALNREELGLLFKTMHSYARFGLEPEQGVLPEKMSLVWPMIRDRLDVDRQRYEEKCKNRSASAQGAAAKAARSSGGRTGSSWRPEKKDEPFYAGNLGDKFLAEVEFEAMRKEKLAMLENKDGE